MTLRIAFGAVSEAGRRERNEDFFGLVTPEGELLASKGIVAAIADGVGDDSGGREAAEYAVLSVLSDYYDTPETWEIPHALGKLLSSANRWLLAQGASHREFASMATTLSLVVLRGNRYSIAHVGDTRIYRMRGDEFALLTRDHVWEGTGMDHVLKRAVGLDMHLAVDYADGELKKNDVFLLVSDGIWETLGNHRMQDILTLNENPERASQALVDAALEAGSEGNVTAQVMQVLEVDQGALRDLLMEGADLPLPPPLSQGQRIDGYEVLTLLHESEKKRLYKVREESTGRLLVLKTLKPRLEMENRTRSNLLLEEWLGKKVLSHHFAHAVQAENRHFLYTLATWHDGSTLGEMLEKKHHFSVAESAQIAAKLGKALSALHRLDIIHRDIRPENIHLGKDGKLRLLGLSAAKTPALESEEEFSGPLPYRAPEIFSGESAGIQSDLYSLGVSLYHILTRQFPYGDIEAGKTPRFADPVPPSRYRPDIPKWLENILLKAVTRDPERRFETPEEFLMALERGESAPISAPPKLPLASRNRLTAWKLTATISILVNFFLLYIDAVETLGFSSGPPW